MEKRSKRLRAPLIVLAVLAATLAAAPTRADEDYSRDRHDGERADAPSSRVERGFEILPPGVYLNLAGKNRNLVGLGSYIVNSTGCVDCHTHPSYLPGGDPYQGFPQVVNFKQYMTGGRQFGPITSANLTPDGTGKPAGLTLAQFLVTLRTGHNPNDPPGEILQIMPWPAYGQMTQRDLTAVYEFLRALPSLPNNPSPGP